MRRVSVVALAATLAMGLAHDALPTRTASLVRVELHLRADARAKPQLVLMTVGGFVYCAQLKTLARNIGASLVCTDYAPNGYVARGARARREMDWGDRKYLDEVALVPNRLRAQGVRIQKLVFVGVSYSGFGNAELVATHPELRPAALIVVDSYLDLPARYRALLPTHLTKAEIERAVGGTLEEKPLEFALRSPSHHLNGLARAIRAGMRFVDVWSVSPREQREFNGATCGRLANAQWLAKLASVLKRPVAEYVTQLPHAHALWDRGRALLALAGVTPPTSRPLMARRVTFAPGAKSLPQGSYCGS